MFSQATLNEQAHFKYYHTIVNELMILSLKARFLLELTI